MDMNSSIYFQRTEGEEMISRERALEIVEQYLDTENKSVPGGIALIIESTLEKPYGWVFFYNSKRFLETKDPFESLAGNSPILIESKDGRMTLLGTSSPVTESLRNFETRMGIKSESK